MSPRNGFGYPLPASERRHRPLQAAQTTLCSSTDGIKAHATVSSRRLILLQSGINTRYLHPLLPGFSPALPRLPSRFFWVDSRYLSSVGTSPRWQSPSTAPAGTASWLSADHRKQFIPLLMIYIISLDSLLAYEVFCFFYYSLENQTRVFQKPGGSSSAEGARCDRISVR